jgi:aspartyl-tRNA synthetase (EC 6.1.1.12)
MDRRTHYCGEIKENHIGERVVLKGWVHRRRDLGGLIFIDLRDRTGLVQVVFNPEVSSEAFHIADQVRSEYVIGIAGTVVPRAEGTENPRLKTGKIEIRGEKIEIINKSKTPPFVIADDTDVSEEMRLKYRYLDLRRPIMFETFRLRHQTVKAIREFLDSQRFMEVETPYLTKSTPEGARDYLVPSRIHHGKFYALPQSPQLFKQLLMVAGFDRYYQVARCFRDEDLRADRQPEFTQIDIEMSFVEVEDILHLTEQMMRHVVRRVKGIDLQIPFVRMTYHEAMNRFGSDKPDIRFGLELKDVTDAVKNSGFRVFVKAAESGGCVKGINVSGKAEKYSRKDIDHLASLASRYGAKGLAWMKVAEEGLTGPIAKFFDDGTKKEILAVMDGKPGDLLLFVADKWEVATQSLGAIRSKLGTDLGLIDEKELAFLWVTEWPLFEYSEEDGRYYAAHHPFTMPYREDLDLMETDPGRVRAQAYDIVLNGYELGGGSIRIFEQDVQEKMFKALGFTKEEAWSQFGFLLEAFEYGTPPHGGIALGLDRLVMLLSGRNNLRDTIAFPKTASASDLLTEAPSPVSPLQLHELGIEILPEEEETSGKHVD